MEKKVFEEEYIREQGRLAARRDTEQKIAQKAKTSLVKNAPWLALLILLVFAVTQLGGWVGINPRVFLEGNFLFPALGLTAGFLWLLVRS